MNKLIPAAILGAALAQAVPAQAHTMWINVVPEYDKHVIASIAYGDAMPGSELLTPDWWPMHVARYEVIDPDGKRASLGVPKLVTAEKKQLDSGMQVQAGGDIGQRKFIIKPQTTRGTYQLAAATPVARVVNYVDRQGNAKYLDANLTELPEGATVTRTTLGVNLMKAAFAVGAWSDPEPVGLPLEIVPLSDLHAARVGDRVRFKVLLNGAALNPEVGAAHIVAYNMGFGDRWGLHSELKYGEGAFRIPEAGLWRVDAAFRGTSDDVEAYRSAETLPISIESSFVFLVRP